MYLRGDWIPVRQEMLSLSFRCKILPDIIIRAKLEHTQANLLWFQRIKPSFVFAFKVWKIIKPLRCFFSGVVRFLLLSVTLQSIIKMSHLSWLETCFILLALLIWSVVVCLWFAVYLEKSEGPHTHLHFILLNWGNVFFIFKMIDIA